MRWCRLYVETPTDPKLRRIAHTAGATLAHTLAVWTSMLCHAASNEGEAWGTLAGWDDVDCAINLGMDPPIVFAIRREMEGRIIEGTRILKWDQRQAKTDHSAERMRQWRAKRAQGKQEPSSDVTSRSVTVTQSDGKKRREEKRRDGETTVSPVRRASRAAVSVAPPQWLEPRAWDEWCRYRHGRKWTQRAAELSLSKLAELHAVGHDPRAVIEQSIANGWTGLFELKGARPTQAPSRNSNIAWMDELLPTHTPNPPFFDGTAEEV